MAEASDLTGKTERQLRYLIKQEKLPATKVKGEWRFEREDLFSIGMKKAAAAKESRARGIAGATLPLPIADKAARTAPPSPERDSKAPREVVKGYVRYLDDAVLFGDSRAELAEQRTRIRQWLLEERALHLNPKKGHIRPCELPQSFLGYRITSGGVDLGPKALRRFRKKREALLEADPASREAAWQSLRGAMVF